MRCSARFRTFPRVAALLLVAVACASLAAAVRAQASPKPPNPSDQQIQQARDAKSAAAKDAGAIAGRMALLESQLEQLASDAQLAEQRLALALQRKQQAEDAAVAARAKVTDAKRRVLQAHARFVQFVQASYMSGSVSGTGGTLLAADDPSSLLEQAALQDYEASHKADVIGQLTSATVVKSNAEAAARRAVQKQNQAATAATVAQQNVLTALAAAKARKADLERQLAAERELLKKAQMRLTGLTNQRAAYLEWKRQQAALAAKRARELRERRLAQQRAAAAEAARLERRHHGGGNAAPPATGGGWSPAKGRTAVDRAMRYLGWPYSWAAGDANGPTYGVSEPGAAWNDSNIRGFDCSGLTLYAWAPWLSMDHYAATQYTQAGSYHPSINQLMPGDLVFWSGNGTIGGIGHEAMYIGSGNVIQAPQSGDVIKITNIYAVESGYFGATRPLT